MPSNKSIINATIGGLLVFGFAAAALPAVPAHAATTDTAGGTALAADGSDTGFAASADTGVSIARDGGAVAFPTLEEAVDAAASGETIDVSGALTISRPLTIEGKSVTLRATDSTVITRAADYPLSGGKPDAMVRIGAGGALVARGAAGGADTLVFDGANVDSQEALVRIDGSGASFTQQAGATVSRGLSTGKPWSGVYVRAGSYSLEGGSISQCRAMRNAAIAVERAGAVTMTGGSISGNGNSQSATSVWISGTFTMTGGSISANGADTGSSGGMVEVLANGVLTFTGGVIGETAVATGRTVLVNGQGTLRMGAGARIQGERDHVRLASGAVLTVADLPAHHNRDNRLSLVLQGSLDSGRPVAVLENGGDANALRDMLYVTSADSGESLSVMPDPDDPRRLVLPVGDTAELLSLLDEPYADGLGLQLKPEFQGEHAFADIKARLDALYGGADSPDARDRYDRLEYLQRQQAYVGRHRQEIEDSVITLSQLGDANRDRERTQHQFRFDNLDITGYSLSPGTRRINLYLEAEDPSKVSLAWRQIGRSDHNSYTSLNMTERGGLRNGENRLTIDLSGYTHGVMLFLINASDSNDARARLEGADANADDAPAVTGTQLGRHPFYLHDADHPERFWDYVESLRVHADAVRAGDGEDMTMLQMGDGGHAQFSMRATYLADVYDQEKLTSRDAATAYIRKSNEAIQERLSFYWEYEGFDVSEGSGPNAASAMRVHTSFTSNVVSPSNMYAFNRYFHMPEGTMRAFLNGSAMYGWGMSHEYGHMLDNTVFKVNEETNNLYSLAGARHGGILASEQGKFSTNVYHGNALKAAKRWDERLAAIAADPGYQYDWNEGGVWGSYIWTHLMAWWNGLHYFDGWDYADYDYASGPYTPERAEEVRTWGAFGAMLRMLRSEPDTVSTITDLTRGIANSGSMYTQQYNRLALAATMAIGYDFADYLTVMGEPDLTDGVREFCARYPKMPRKIAYYSIDVDAAEINGATTFPAIVRPTASVERGADGAFTVRGRLPEKLDGTYVAAWELYHDGRLVGFSRDGSFSYKGDGSENADGFSVVAYDVRLNPSLPSGDGPLFTVDAPESLTVGDQGTLTTRGIVDGASYRYRIVDQQPATDKWDTVLTVSDDGSLTAVAPGTATVRVSMSDRRRDSETVDVTISVKRMKITAQVGDAEMTVGDPMPEPGLTLVDGTLLGDDTLSAAAYTATTDDGRPADTGTAGEYAITADATVSGRPEFYRLTVRPGRLVVHEAPQTIPPDADDDQTDGEPDKPDTDTGNPDGDNPPAAPDTDAPAEDDADDPTNGDSGTDGPSADDPNGDDSPGSGPEDGGTDGNGDGTGAGNDPADGPGDPGEDNPGGNAPSGTDGDAVDDGSNEDASDDGNQENAPTDGSADGNAATPDVASKSGSGRLSSTGTAIQWAWGAVALLAAAGAAIAAARRLRNRSAHRRSGR